MDRLSICGDTADALLRGVFEAILAGGETVQTSRGDTRELRGASLQLLNPRARLSRSERRGRAVSAIGEFVWYASGSDDPSMLERYIPSYREAIGSSEVSNGAYGPRLFGQAGQFSSIVGILRDRPTSRQAVIQLFDSQDLLGNPRDVPCTCTLQFLVRGGRLEVIVYMRSNDAFFGLPHDLFAFTMLQELAATMLGLELGTYTHMVGSLHVYEKNMAGVHDYLDEGVFEFREMDSMPEGSSLNDLDALVEWEAAIRNQAVRVADLRGYWAELALVLMAWDPEPSVGHVHATTAEVRRALQGSYFDIYLSDLELRGDPS